MNPTLLIVEDEIQIAETLKEYLSENYNVLVSHNVDSAFELINKNKINLILSDIKMPGRSGLDLFQQYKQNIDTENSTPFVLMTAHADVISVKNAFEIGIDELIAKPFDLEAIRLVIDYLLDSDRAYGNENDTFFSVPIEEFILSKTSNYSLFLRVADRHIRVTKAGQEFTAQRLENFAKKGATHIYLNSSDFAKYTDLQFAISTTITRRPLDEAKKVRIMNHLMGSISQSGIATQIDQKFLSRSIAAFEAYTNVALNQPQLSTILSFIVTENPSLAEIATLRAIISSSISTLWKWNSSKIQSRVILASLFCDVGLKDHKRLLEKKRIEYSKEEMALYEQHPLTSFQMLKQIDDIPPELLSVALQHHENAAGLGFPQKLPRSKTHSYSKLIQGVELFIETIQEQEDKTNIKMALDRITELQSKFLSEQVLKSLYMLFNLEVPKQLSNLLLPTDTTRVV